MGLAICRKTLPARRHQVSPGRLPLTIVLPSGLTRCSGPWWREALRTIPGSGVLEHSTAPTPRFGQAVTAVGNETMVRVWGDCDGGRAWLVRQVLDDVTAIGEQRITLDVSELRFTDFTAVAILAGALARIRRLGAEVTVSPPSSGAYQVLKRADPTTFSVGAGAVEARASPSRR